MSSVSGSSHTQGAELLTAALDKKQQNQDAAMALSLIESAVAASPVQGTSTVQSSTANLGNHINIKA